MIKTLILTDLSLPPTYIDDLGVFGFSMNINIVHGRICDKMDRVGLPIAKRNLKMAEEGKTSVGFLGCMVESTERLSPSRRFLKGLL